MVTASTTNESWASSVLESPGCEATDRDRQRPSPTLGKYGLTRLIARGGSGEVYQAEDRLGNCCAIKVLLPRVAADKVRLLRFYQEANAMLAIEHPNVLQCYEVSESMGQHYLVTEWLEGANLAAWVQEKGCFGERRALRVIAQLARGLAAVHAHGVLHRDVSPNNIMMTPQGEVKLIDFEFAKNAVTDLGLTAEGVGLGRADYVSPEQLVSARDVDQRTDIYALGATLYAMLTNRLPFPGHTYQQKWEAKQNDLYIPPQSLAPHVGDELQAFIARLMVAAPDARMQSAIEVANAAEELLRRLKQRGRGFSEHEQLKAQMWRTTTILPNGEIAALEAFELEIADMIRRGKLPLTAQAARGGVPPYRPITQIPEFRAAIRSVSGGSQSLNELAQNGRSGCSSLLETVGSALTSLGKSMSVPGGRSK